MGVIIPFFKPEIIKKSEPDISIMISNSSKHIHSDKLMENWKKKE